MREYLYLWRNMQNSCLVASGIEFADFSTELRNSGGLILLEHGHQDAVIGPRRLDFVYPHEIVKMAQDDVQSYPDLVWVDCRPSEGSAVPDITDQDLAALLYFGHTATPLGGVTIPSIGNRFLSSSHDDGWRLNLFYSAWSDLEPLLETLLEKLVTQGLTQSVLERLRNEDTAFWITKKGVEVVERTEDIDAMINSRTGA